MTIEILNCPMCGSKATLDATSVAECYGKDWQSLYIYCSKEKDPHCGMELSLQADFWNIKNSNEVLIKCWNALDRV